MTPLPSDDLRPADIVRRYRLSQVLAELDQDPIPVGNEFLIHYTLRNQIGKPGYGARGTSRALIDCYVEEIQWALNFLAGIGLKRNGTRLCNIYVFDPAEAEGLAPAPQIIIDPGSQGDDESLAIVLPSRTFLPESAAERLYLGAAAIHEVTHVVCFEQEILGGTIPEDTGWKWLSEGTAEWVSLTRGYEIAPDRAQSFEFVADWCAYPEAPINHEDVWYSSVVFVDYLARLRENGPKWIGEAWKAATPKKGDDPWRKIQHDFGRGIFMKFCCDAYFLNDPNGNFHCPAVFARFGSRAWTHSFDGGTNDWIPAEVYDFACQYFAIFPNNKTQTLILEFEFIDPDIRAVVLGSSPDCQEVGDRVTVEMNSTKIDISSYHALHHFVLVVTTEPSSSIGGLKSHGFRFRAS